MLPLGNAVSQPLAIRMMIFKNITRNQTTYDLQTHNRQCNPANSPWAFSRCPLLDFFYLRTSGGESVGTCDGRSRISTVSPPIPVFIQDRPTEGNLAVLVPGRPWKAPSRVGSCRPSIAPLPWTVSSAHLEQTPRVLYVKTLTENQEKFYMKVSLWCSLRIIVRSKWSWELSDSIASKPINIIWGSVKETTFALRGKISDVSPNVQILF